MNYKDFAIQNGEDPVLEEILPNCREEEPFTIFERKGLSGQSNTHCF